MRHLEFMHFEFAAMIGGIFRFSPLGMGYILYVKKSDPNIDD